MNDEMLDQLASAQALLGDGVSFMADGGDVGQWSDYPPEDVKDWKQWHTEQAGAHFMMAKELALGNPRRSEYHEMTGGVHLSRSKYNSKASYMIGDELSRFYRMGWDHGSADFDQPKFPENEVYMQGFNRGRGLDEDNEDDDEGGGGGDRPRPNPNPPSTSPVNADFTMAMADGGDVPIDPEMESLFEEHDAKDAEIYPNLTKSEREQHHSLMDLQESGGDLTSEEKRTLDDLEFKHLGFAADPTASLKQKPRTKSDWDFDFGQHFAEGGDVNETQDYYASQDRQKSIYPSPELKDFYDLHFFDDAEQERLRRESERLDRSPWLEEFNEMATGGDVPQVPVMLEPGEKITPPGDDEEWTVPAPIGKPDSGDVFPAMLEPGTHVTPKDQVKTERSIPHMASGGDVGTASERFNDDFEAMHSNGLGSRNTMALADAIKKLTETVNKTVAAMEKADRKMPMAAAPAAEGTKVRSTTFDPAKAKERFGKAPGGTGHTSAEGLAAYARSQAARQTQQAQSS